MERWKSGDTDKKNEAQPVSDASQAFICLNLFLPEIYGYGPESIIWEEFVFSPSDFYDGEFSSLLVKICEVYQVQKLNNILVEVNSSLLEVYVVVRSFQRLRDNGFYIFGSVKTIKKLRRSLLFGKSASSPSRIGAGSAAYLRSLSVNVSRGLKDIQSPDSTRGSVHSRHAEQSSRQGTRSHSEDLSCNARRAGAEKKLGERRGGEALDAPPQPKGALQGGQPPLPCPKCVSGSLGLRHDPECPALFGDNSEEHSDQEEFTVSEVSFRSEIDDKQQIQENILQSDQAGEEGVPLDFEQAMADLQKEFGDPLPYLREGGSGLLPSPSKAQRGQTGDLQHIKPVDLGSSADTATQGPSGHIVTEGRLQMMKMGRSNQYICRFDGCVKFGSQKDGEPFSHHYFGPFVRHMEEKHGVVVLPDSYRLSSRRFEVRRSDGKLLGYRCNYLGCKDSFQLVTSHDTFRHHMQRAHRLTIDEGSQSTGGSSSMGGAHQIQQRSGRSSDPPEDTILGGQQSQHQGTSPSKAHLGEALCRLARDGERPRGGHGGQRAQADALLNQGADPDFLGSQGDTPLLLAAGYGKLGVALALLDAGADVNKAGRFGDTPLHRACFHLRTDLVRLLLKHGADPKARDYKGQIPGTKFKPRTRPQEEKAVADILQFYQKQIGLLNSRLPMSSLVKNGRYVCPYHTSSRSSGNSRCAKNQVYSQRLIAHMQESHGKEVYFDTPYKDLGEQLLDAARAGQMPLLARLISKGADPNYEAKRSSSFDDSANTESSGGVPDGCTPLLAAVEGWHEPAVKFLLEVGANINKGDRGQRRPLHVACKPPTPCPSLVALLLDNGARPHLRTRRGHAPEDLLRQASGPAVESSLRLLHEAQSARRSRNPSGIYTDDDSTSTSVIKSGTISDDETPALVPHKPHHLPPQPPPPTSAPPASSLSPTAPATTFNPPPAPASQQSLSPTEMSAPEPTAVSVVAISDNIGLSAKTLLVRQDPTVAFSTEEPKPASPPPFKEKVLTISSVDEANKLVSSIFPNLSKSPLPSTRPESERAASPQIIEHVSVVTSSVHTAERKSEVDKAPSTLPNEEHLDSDKVPTPESPVSSSNDVLVDTSAGAEGAVVDEVAVEDKEAVAEEVQVVTVTQLREPGHLKAGTLTLGSSLENATVVVGREQAQQEIEEREQGQQQTKDPMPATAPPRAESPSPLPPPPPPKSYASSRSRSASPAPSEDELANVVCTHCSNKGHTAEVCVLKRPEFSSWEEMAEDSEGANSADSTAIQSFPTTDEALPNSQPLENSQKLLDIEVEEQI